MINNALSIENNRCQEKCAYSTGDIADVKFKMNIPLLDVHNNVETNARVTRPVYLRSARVCSALRIFSFRRKRSEYRRIFGSRKTEYSVRAGTTKMSLEAARTMTLRS